MLNPHIRELGFHEYELPVSHDIGFTALGKVPNIHSDLVVFVPGLAENVEYFLPLISGTIGQRYTPLIINALVTQDSRLLQAVEEGEKLHDLDNLGVFLSNAFDHLPCRSLSIVSHSLGEAVVLSALEKKERNLKRYISLAGGITGGPLVDAERFLAADFVEAISPGLIEECGFFREEIPAYIEQCIGSFINYRDRYEHVFSSLRCPRIFIRGDSDSCTGISNFDEKIIIPGAGHDICGDSLGILERELVRVLF